MKQDSTNKMPCPNSENDSEVFSDSIRESRWCIGTGIQSVVDPCSDDAEGDEMNLSQWITLRVLARHPEEAMTTQQVQDEIQHYLPFASRSTLAGEVPEWLRRMTDDELRELCSLVARERVLAYGLVKRSSDGMKLT